MMPTPPDAPIEFPDRPTGPHLAGLEQQVRLLRATEGMLIAGSIGEYWFRRTAGVTCLLERLFEDGLRRGPSTLP